MRQDEHYLFLGSDLDQECEDARTALDEWLKQHSMLIMMFYADSPEVVKALLEQDAADVVEQMDEEGANALEASHPIYEVFQAGFKLRSTVRDLEG